MKANLRRALPLAAVATLFAFASLRAEPMYATNGSIISRFDSNTPGTVTSVGVTGLQAGETLVGIDIRPANGLLYGVGTTSRLYTINPLTGVATQVGSGQFASALNGTAFGTDFNPVPDRVRQVSNTEQNLRLNPNDGTALVDGALNPAGNIVAVAYSNNFAGAVSTILYGIDSAAGTLVQIGSPNSGGPITTIGSLGLGTNLSEAIGFDISGVAGTAFASITSGGLSRLYSINLATGNATNLGTIGNGGTSFLGLTAATAVPEPSTYMLLGAGALVFAFARRLRRSGN